MTNSGTSFLKLIVVYIYIYSLSSYLAVDTVFPSERPMGEQYIWNLSLLLLRMGIST